MHGKVQVSKHACTNNYLRCTKCAVHDHVCKHVPTCTEKHVPRFLIPEALTPPPPQSLKKVTHLFPNNPSLKTEILPSPPSMKIWMEAQPPTGGGGGGAHYEGQMYLLNVKLYLFNSYLGIRAIWGNWTIPTTDMLEHMKNTPKFSALHFTSNQVLLFCQDHLIIELYLPYGYLGIREIWGNWAQIPHKSCTGTLQT